MKGKVCMVTGASSGIGEVLALELAKTGANVVMVCRDGERGERARAGIVKASGNDDVELMLADFRSLNDIRKLASEFKGRHDRLHVLANNAAIIPRERRVTADGLEEQFQVNHLSHFLLTHLLLEPLKAGAPSRVVGTSSGVHRNARLDFEDLQSMKRYKPMRVYGTTKLMNIYFTYELAKRLSGTGVTVNCFSPGFRKTRLDREFSAVMRFFVKLLAGKREKGARTAVYLATSPEVEGTTGRYFSNCRPSESSPLSHDQGVGLRLWELSEKMTGLEGLWKR